MLGHFRDLTVERGRHRARRDALGPCRPVPRNVLLARAAGEGGDDQPLAWSAFPGAPQRRQRLVEHHVGRDHALRARRLEPRCLAVDLTGMFAQARQIGFRVRGGLDLVLRVQEARLIEVGAHILRDGVGPLRQPPDREASP
jgi:hypothetical protein